VKVTAAPRPPDRRRELTREDYVAGVRAGDRAVLARAITLVESALPAHQDLAQAVLSDLLPEAGGAWRVGITGVPGVGKSAFIEALGKRLTGAGHRLAVLAVDPSSGRSGGSILGDKTRMVELAHDPAAFVRPSPSAGTLGGVARRTRESMLLCEAAGYDVVFVETVGVGQSETAVADMVDFFLVLALAGAGDELQGIKRGLVELADLIAVNKADGENVARARRAALEYQSALDALRTGGPSWRPRVTTVSALEGAGLDDLWAAVRDHRERLEASGELAAKRRRQLVRWMWSQVHDRLLTELKGHPAVAADLAEVERAVEAGRLTPGLAADRLLEAFFAGRPGPEERER